MGYEHCSPAQMVFPCIPRFSNIVIIGAISARVLSLDITKFCAFIVKYKESFSSFSKLMLHASPGNKELKLCTWSMVISVY